MLRDIQRFWCITKNHLLTSNCLQRSKGGNRGLSKFKILKNKCSGVSPACDSLGVSFFRLSFAISEVYKEIPEANSGSLHIERYYSSPFTHLKIFLNNVFSLAVCVAQYYFLLHVFLCSPWWISLFVYWIILWTCFCFFSETSKLFFLC